MPSASGVSLATGFVTCPPADVLLMLTVQQNVIFVIRFYLVPVSSQTDVKHQSVLSLVVSLSAEPIDIQLA